jgi:hypothetical protein
MLSRIATLLIMLGLAWWLYDFARTEDSLYEPPQLGGPLFPGLETRDVDFVSMSFRTGHVVDLRRERGGPWLITYPTDELAQAEYVERVLENLATAMVIPIESQTGPVDPEAVGLAKTPYSVTFGIGGVRRTVLIGDVEVFGKGIYARVEGTDEVFLTSPALRTMVEQFRAEDYVDKHLLRGLRGSINAIRVERAGGVLLDAQIDGNEWTIQAPVPSRADSSRVPTLVRGLQFIQQVLVAAVDPEDSILTELGLPTQRQLAVGDWGESMMVQLSAAGEKPARVFIERDWEQRADACYAIRDDLHKLLEIDRNMLNLLANEPEFFRERRALPPVRERTTSFRIERDGVPGLDIRRDRQARWFFEAPERLKGLEVDANRIEGRSSLSDFLTRVDGLSVVGFCDEPIGEPEASIRIGWNWAGRDRTDKIELFDLSESMIRARSSFRPGEGLLLAPEVIELFAPFVADELRSLRPVEFDLASWARLEIHLPDLAEPLTVSRSPESGQWEGDDQWGRRFGIGLQVAESFSGYVWRPELPDAVYPWRVVFLDASGNQLEVVRIRRPEPSEDREALGVPIDVASIDGVDGAVMLIPDYWLARIIDLVNPQGR